jgi:hypothetical protein
MVSGCWRREKGQMHLSYIPLMAEDKCSGVIQRQWEFLVVIHYISTRHQIVPSPSSPKMNQTLKLNDSHSSKLHRSLLLILTPYCGE